MIGKVMLVAGVIVGVITLAIIETNREISKAVREAWK